MQSHALAARRCSHCLENLPLNQFRVTDRKTQRRRAACRACEYSESTERRRIARSAGFRKMLSDANRLRAAGATLRLGQVVAEAVRACGGVAMFGQRFRELHDHAVAEGDSRLALRAMKMVLDLVVTNDEHLARYGIELTDCGE